MGIVIPFPQRQRIDDELATQLWELIMAGETDGPEFRRLDAEVRRRQRSLPTPARGASRPWR